MRIRVLVFGAVREALGRKELDLELSEGAVVADVRERLRARHAIFDEYGDRLLVSRNRAVADPDDRLAEGDEVAFLPPVSGGAGDGLEGARDRPEGDLRGAAGAAPRRCTLSDRPLDVGEVVARVGGPDCGGIVTFVGAVRNRARGHAIRFLEYEAYPAMAEAEMERIAQEAGQRWPGCRVAMAHRHGHLEIGDLAVVVVAAAPHRAEAFEACRFAIDTLKEKVPIWKKEVATDGAYWVDDHA